MTVFLGWPGTVQLASFLHSLTRLVCLPITRAKPTPSPHVLWQVRWSCANHLPRHLWYWRSTKSVVYSRPEIRLHHTAS
jgi:hypothetical protein